MHQSSPFLLGTGLGGGGAVTDPWSEEDFHRLKRRDGGVMGKDGAGRGEGAREAVMEKTLAGLRTTGKILRVPRFVPPLMGGRR